MLKIIPDDERGPGSPQRLRLRAQASVNVDTGQPSQMMGDLVSQRQSANAGSYDWKYPYWRKTGQADDMEESMKEASVQGARAGL